jgi:membrane protease YdiL (CAAX protease family)
MAEAELARTALRLGAVWLYWGLFRNLLESMPLVTAELTQARFVLAMLLMVSIPLLVSTMGHFYTGQYDIGTRWLYAVTSIAVGFKEEITFRALIQNLLARKLGHWKAIGLAALLFTAYHIGVVQPLWHVYVSVALAGMLLGAIYAHTKNLWLVVAIHALYDSLWPVGSVLLVPASVFLSVPLTMLSLALIVSWSWSALSMKTVPAQRR